MNRVLQFQNSSSENNEYNVQYKLIQLSQKIGYPIHQVNGQRYFGPPSSWRGNTPQNAEVFIARLPKNCIENDIYQFCSLVGTVYLIRMMVNHDGSNRGFCFVTFADQDEARKAITILPYLKFLKKYTLSLEKSDENRSIEIIRIDPSFSDEEIKQELYNLLQDITHVGLKRWPDSSCKAFVYFENHQQAAYARRKLSGIVAQTFGIGSKVILVDKKMKEMKKNGPCKENADMRPNDDNRSKAAKNGDFKTLSSIQFNTMEQSFKTGMPQPENLSPSLIFKYGDRSNDQCGCSSFKYFNGKDDFIRCNTPANESSSSGNSLWNSELNFGQSDGLRVRESSFYGSQLNPVKLSTDGNLEDEAGITFKTRFNSNNVDSEKLTNPSLFNIMKANQTVYKPITHAATDYNIGTPYHPYDIKSREEMRFIQTSNVNDEKFPDNVKYMCRNHIVENIKQMIK